MGSAFQSQKQQSCSDFPGFRRQRSEAIPLFGCVLPSNGRETGRGGEREIERERGRNRERLREVVCEREEYGESERER